MNLLVLGILLVCACAEKDFNTRFESFYSAAKRDGLKLGGFALFILGGEEGVKRKARNEFRGFMSDPVAAKLVQCVERDRFDTSTESWNSFSTFFCQHEKITSVRDELGPYCKKKNRRTAKVDLNSCNNGPAATPREPRKVQLPTGWVRQSNVVYHTSLKQRGTNHPVWYYEAQLRVPRNLKYLADHFCREEKFPLDPRCSLADAYSKVVGSN